MRAPVFFLLLCLPALVIAQKLKIQNLQGKFVEVTLVAEGELARLVNTGAPDRSLQVSGVSRCYRLAGGQVLLEFFDRQGALLHAIDIADLHGVHFFKPYIDFLKRNITYKIDLPYAEGQRMALTARRLEQFRAYVPGFNEFSLYQLSSGQLLYLAHTANGGTATVFENVKSVASENQDVLMVAYGDLDSASANFVAGDPLWDYNPQQFWVYPSEKGNVIKSHRLKVLRTEVYVDEFYGTLYRSEHGYYVVITEFNQKDMRGVQGLEIGEGRVFKTLEDVAAAEKEYQQRKNWEAKSEHFYQRISDRYGLEFPSKTELMIDSMCAMLNIDRSRLTYDSAGIELVDQAIHWNHDRYWLFGRWYPGVLAFYGACYMRAKGDGKWVMRQERSGADDAAVWVPHLVLASGEEVFNSNEFFKTLMEWAIPLRTAGDWDGWRRARRQLDNKDE